MIQTTPLDKSQGNKTATIETLIGKNMIPKIWDTEPVYCFTSDVDWASEAVLKEFFAIVNGLDIHPTMFVTHNSAEVEKHYQNGKIDRGLHPNFMNGSSHGDGFEEIAETCIGFAPESYGFRSHRAFDVTDITHLMANKHNFKWVSHQITIMQPYIRPILHESGLLNFPVFFEDGTHLYNCLDLKIGKYDNLLTSPGIKIVSFHPMNFVFNTPELSYMRNLKDSMTREQFINITPEVISKFRNNALGIRDTVLEIIDTVKSLSLPIYTMNQLYDLWTE
ncbi:MAG: hypothetical protein PHY48_01760 [Candidatus Cloacimonetes bacterium]|nr:hypothetical protein [Candidatus Cloacimonadota bacterium]